MELQTAQQHCARLERLRTQVATTRTRLHEQEQTSEQLRKRVDTLVLERAAADAESQQLRAQADSAAKQQLRQETKVR